MSPNPLQQHFLFVITRGPEMSLGRDYLDAVMTATLLNQSVSILFLGEGLAQLRDETSLETLRSLIAMAELELFALASPDQPVQAESVRCIDEAQARTLLRSHDRVLSF